MKRLRDPRQARVFRFVDCEYVPELGEARLSYAFDEDVTLIERIRFPGAPPLAPEHAIAFAAALKLLYLIAGVSYYKAGVQAEIRVESDAPDTATAQFMDAVYFHGLGEFAYQNQLDLRDKIRFPAKNFELSEAGEKSVSALDLPRRTLIPVGGGKDSLVSVEILKSIHEPATVVWVGDSPLIAACAQRTGLPTLNITRKLAPELFEYNRLGAYNGHIPVTAINSAILLCAAILYGYDAIAFSNERSASSATLEYAGQWVNHQWSKSFAFEQNMHAYVKSHIAANLDYFSLLRPFSELAVTQRFAQLPAYHEVFSSCNRNFRILGERPTDRWCGQCPKCHFVFLALATFLPKTGLLAIFGRNLLDDETLVSAFDALIEYREHKPFECVGEGRESRAAMHALSRRPEWREDAVIARFAEFILPQLDHAELALAPLLTPSSEHLLPSRLQGLFDAPG